MSFVLEQRLKTVEEKVDAYLQILNLPLRASLDGTETYPLTLPDGTEHQTTLAAMFSDKYLVVSADLDLSIQHRNMILYVDTNDVTITIPENIGWNLGHKVYIIANATGFSLASSGATVLNSPQTFQDVEDSTFKVVYNGSNEYNAVQLGVASGGGGNSLDLGEYSTELALETAHPSPVSGSFARINPVSDDPYAAYWDDDDTTWKYGNGIVGIATEEITFGLPIMADKKYFSTDSNRYSQTGDITITTDSTGASLQGYHIAEIIGSGDDVIFPLTFGSIMEGPLAKTNDRVTTEENKVYLFHFFWLGTKFHCTIGELHEITAPRLNSPTITSATWLNATTARLTITDNNTSPNEVNTLVQATVADTSVWGNDVTMAQDGTTVDVTGLDELVSTEFRAKAIGDGSVSGDSLFSDRWLLPMTGGSIIVVQDDFTGTTIDVGKWTLVGVQGRITQNDRLEINLDHSSNVSELTFDHYLKSNLNQQTGRMVFQFDLESTNEPRSGAYTPIGIMNSDANSNKDLARIIQDATADKVRIQVWDNDVKVEQVIDVGSSNSTFRIDYNLDTNVILFEELIGVDNWNTIAGPYTYDIEDGTGVDAFIICHDDTTATGVDNAYIDNVFICSDTYTTSTPT